MRCANYQGRYLRYGRIGAIRLASNLAIGCVDLATGGCSRESIKCEASLVCGRPTIHSHDPSVPSVVTVS